MGKRKRGSYNQQQKCVEKLKSKVKKDGSLNLSSLKKEGNKNTFKEILNSKIPVVILNNCLTSKNLLNHNLLLNNESLMYRTISTNLTKSNTKKSYKNNLKKHTATKSKYNKQQLKSNLQASKYGSKKNKTNNTLSKRKHPVSSVSTNQFRSDSWKIKYDADLKAKALKSNENLKVCLEKLKCYDENSNIIGPFCNLKVYKKNEIRKEDQYTKSKRRSTYKSKRKHKKTINHENTTKYKQNNYENHDVNRSETSCSSSIDNFSHKAVDLTKAVFCNNDIVHKYMVNAETSTVSDRVVKESNKYCISIKAKHLRLEKVEENVKNTPSKMFYKKVEKIKNLPIIIREDVLLNHSMKLEIKETEVNESYDKSKTFHNNDSLTNGIGFSGSDFSEGISKKENLNIKNHYVVSKIRKTNTDFDKITTKKTVNVVDNGNYNTLENNVSKDSCSRSVQNKNFNVEYNGVDEENNKSSLFPSQSLLTKHYMGINMARTVDATNLKYVQDHTSVIMQKITENADNNLVTYSFDTADLLKCKSIYTNQNINGQPAKKIKLDKNHCFKNDTLASKLCKDVSTFDSTCSVDFKFNTNEIFSRKTTRSMNRINNVVQNNKDIITEIDDSEFNTNNKGILNFMQQTQVTSAKSTDIQEHDTMQNAWKSEEVTSNVQDIPMETQNLMPDEVKSNQISLIDDKDDQSDCISLFADSAFINEYDISSESDSHLKPHYMTDNLFDNYYKSNKVEFNEMYENNNISNTLEEIKCLSKSAQIRKRSNITVHSNFLLSSVFRGCCYKAIESGTCSRRNCCFRHDFQVVMEVLYYHDEQKFFKVLEELVSNDYTAFINNMFKETLNYCVHDFIYILKMLKKLYELNVVTNELTTNITQWLQKPGNSIKVVSEQLATIVTGHDFNFVNWILSVLEKYTECGEYWNTFRTLLTQTEYLEPQIIQTILQECIIIRQHLEDVNINIIQKLNVTTCSKINQKLLLTFNNLIEHKRNNMTIKQDALSAPNSNANLPKSHSTVNKRCVEFPIDDKTTICHNKDNSCETNKDENNNKGTQKEDSFRLYPIDNLPKPHSVHGRERFWKFYVDVYSFQKGLEHNDYDHVMNILNSVKKKEQSLFTSACYQILCNEIMYSQYHLSKLISHAVRIGKTGVLYEILLDITICTLAHLAEKNLWILAHKLLKDVYIMLKIPLNSCQFGAATIMLFVEIYLANQQPIKALTLLKQSNIIFSNRTRWKVQSTIKDDYVRVQIVTILFDELCTMFPDQAVFLFRLLIIDQFNNFYPIDLTRFANKIVSVLLLQEHHELITEVGRLIGDYYFTLSTITYRALITKLVHNDVPLAKQLYQIAIGLGIYSKPQFYPVTHLIINSDWTSEEMFLAIFNLMKQLSSNIGHAIDHIHLKHLSVYLIFESIPLEKQLSSDIGTNQKYDQKIKDSKMLMKNLLKRKFDPPILIKQPIKGNICRLMNKSVLTYLQSEHWE